MKPTYRKSWAGNILMWSYLALGPSFMVKQWFTGFGELDTNLHQFSDALGLVIFRFLTNILKAFAKNGKTLICFYLLNRAR